MESNYEVPKSDKDIPTGKSPSPGLHGLAVHAVLIPGVLIFRRSRSINKTVGLMFLERHGRPGPMEP